MRTSSYMRRKTRRIFILLFMFFASRRTLPVEFLYFFLQALREEDQQFRSKLRGITPIGHNNEDSFPIYQKGQVARIPALCYTTF